MAFLARCPDCGKFQVCVLDVESAVNLFCRECGGVFSPVIDPVPAQENVNWSLATTMVGYEYEPPRRSEDNLVVIADLPSIYPNQRPPRKRGPKRRRKRRTPRIKKIEHTPAPPTPEPVIPAPVIAPTDEAAADPTAPSPEPPAPPMPEPTPASLYRLPPPEAFVRPAKRKVEEEFEDYGKLELNRISIIALFVLVAGLLLTALTSLSYLPLILIALSFVLGFFAVRTSLHEGRRLLIPGATLGVAAVVLIVSIAVFGFGGTGKNSSAAPPPSLNEVQVIPHPQFAGDPNIRTAEWVDASKASLLQAGTRVEVVEAKSGRSDFAIRIRLHRSAGVPGIPGSVFSGSNWNDKYLASLLDGKGKKFEQQPPTVEFKSQGAPGSAPSNAIEVVLQFPELTNFVGLRLELPAAAWGGNGTLKFAIPQSMVKR